jgi:hypothetical protein
LSHSNVCGKFIQGFDADLRRAEGYAGVVALVSRGLVDAGFACAIVEPGINGAFD